MNTDHIDDEDEDVPTQKCTACGVNAATFMHACPGAYELYGDSAANCNCCDPCKSECAGDA